MALKRRARAAGAKREEWCGKKSRGSTDGRRHDTAEPNDLVWARGTQTTKDGATTLYSGTHRALYLLGKVSGHVKGKMRYIKAEKSNTGHVSAR
jgi:hypothetical protein